MKAVNPVNRRSFLRTGILGLAATASSCAHRLDTDRAASAEVATAFDREVNAFMEARRIPGGTLAVVKDRRLIYAKGYGWADREKKIPASPASLFRIASISKPVTAVAVMKLVEAGKLSLDAKAFDLIRLAPVLRQGRQPDARLAHITILQLLQHTGGWDRDMSADPMFRSEEIAEQTGTPAPAAPEAIIRFMLGRRLDFDPGTRYAYSNFGYCVLGRIIEKVSGVSYEQFVREQVLAPIGIQRMRIGATLDGRQAHGAVRYYTSAHGLAKNVFPGGDKEVPWPYGGFHLEAMDAHGGWIASVVDLARFAAALDGPGSSPLLKPETIRAMYAPPEPPAWRAANGQLADAFYGCGWMVRPHAASGRANFWHSGSLPGTTTLLVRRWDGLNWAVLFNQRSNNGALPDSAIDPALHRAAAAVTDWPTQDLFSKF